MLRVAPLVVILLLALGDCAAAGPELAHVRRAFEASRRGRAIAEAVPIRRESFVI